LDRALLILIRILIVGDAVVVVIVIKVVRYSVLIVVANPRIQELIAIVGRAVVVPFVVVGRGANIRPYINPIVTIVAMHRNGCLSR